LPQVKKHKLFTKNLLLSYHLSFFRLFSLTIVIFQVVTIIPKMGLALGKSPINLFIHALHRIFAPKKPKTANDLP